MNQEQKPQAQYVHFCTYKNSATKGQWQKSREYMSVEALMKAMLTYISKHPTTTVQFQCTVKYM
jgi:hypothetical protein